MHQTQTASAAINAIYHAESRQVLATLIRLLGDFDAAEEAMHDAFRAALEQWPREGIPAKPRAWLISTGRFKGIDQLRRDARYELLEDPEALIDKAGESVELEGSSLEDDRLRLRLIFTCCHPALSADAQVALTLREVCGLATEDIAGAFLTASSTLAQRIVRAKAKIRNARIPYRVPDADELPERLDSVLRVIYLVFNEGYSASSGAALMRQDLSAEAIRLARLLVELLPEAEVLGLLALMLLHESRRQARSDDNGELILLAEQNRTLWDQNLIAEGLILAETALRSGRYGAYTLQAAISAVHAESGEAAATDWRQIVGLYDLLLNLEPSAIVELNRAVAVEMRDGPAAGLVLIDAIFARDELNAYYLAHAARADLLRQLGHNQQAIDAYRQALRLARQAPEQRFLQRRLEELTKPI